MIACSLCGGELKGDAYPGERHQMQEQCIRLLRTRLEEVESVVSAFAMVVLALTEGGISTQEQEEAMH